MITSDGREPSPIMPPVDSAEFNALLREMSVEYAPRRFALCEVSTEVPDGWVFGWGVEFTGSTVVFRWGGRAGGTFRSTEDAVIAWSQLRAVRLVWIDPEPLTDTDCD